MAFRLPPPPQSNDLKGPAWQDWFYKLAAAFKTLKSVVWNAIDFTGSNLTDIQIRNHNDLQNIQGGAPGDYQHLTTAQVASIGTGGGGKASGTPVFFADDSESLFDNVGTSSSKTGGCSTGMSRRRTSWRWGRFSLSTTRWSGAWFGAGEIARPAGGWC